MKDTLKSIVDKIPGAKGAILMGFDGIAVEQYDGGSGVDIEGIATEFSFRFVELLKATKALELGALTDITIKAERGTLLVRCLSDEFFTIVLLADSGSFGKGRWVLKSAAPDLLASL
ncbi:roadblock/LC7 domain-containing protein [Nannocystis pusilla]|uniref:Roadblock/LC7 domain-containing protein n=1 Tax=Nannocystis pusilla TaxID=889268 RepID=A0ABS7TYP5_9BACT|nr:roadblock/LC7 domain-containing protein [Nannocystis pusilla]MBZ5713399.1 roadblock/LC7 domain-containing protein [Nannocystis pusilla]